MIYKVVYYNAKIIQKTTYDKKGIYLGTSYSYKNFGMAMDKGYS